MTIAIASYQRRVPLVRLLRELAAQAEAASELIEGLEVVVVLDGSTDGSLEAVRALEMPVPVDCRWQENRGLAAARNAALGAARGEIVWFLDDDLRPGPNLLRRHREEHGDGPDHLMLGPCRPDPTAVAGKGWVKWWEKHLGELTRTGVVDRFDRFTLANMSGPASIFRAAGGLDEAFRDYGMEDHELGYRILAAHVPVRFDPAAGAWHEHTEGERTEIRRERTIARNTVLLARRHPDTLPALFPGGDPGLVCRLLARSGIRSPRLFLAVSALAAWPGTRLLLPWRVRNAVLSLAHSASYAAGIAETAPGLLRTVLTGDVAHPSQLRADQRA